MEKLGELFFSIGYVFKFLKYFDSGVLIPIIIMESGKCGRREGVLEIFSKMGFAYL